jgi:hypothetical protein
MEGVGNEYNSLVGGLTGGDNLGDLGVDMRTIFKQTLNTSSMWDYGLDSSGLERGPVAGSCGRDGGDFLDGGSDCWLFKKVGILCTVELGCFVVICVPSSYKSVS